MSAEQKRRCLPWRHQWSDCRWLVCGIAGDMQCGEHRCLRCGKRNEGADRG